MKYLTDGKSLYEIADRRTVQNYGLAEGIIRYTIIRDCVSEETDTIDDLHLATLTEVGGADVWDAGPVVFQAGTRGQVEMTIATAT